MEAATLRDFDDLVASEFGFVAEESVGQSVRAGGYIGDDDWMRVGDLKPQVGDGDGGVRAEVNNRCWSVRPANQGVSLNPLRTVPALSVGTHAPDGVTRCPL